MKRLILLLVASNLFTYSYSQNYYWSQGKKNYLTIDSTHVIISEDATNKLPATYALEKRDIKRIASSKLLSIKSKTAIIKKDLELLANDSINYSYKLNGKEITPTGKILLQVLDKSKLKDIEYLIHGAYSIEQLSDKGTYLISLEQWENCIEIANSIYESGKVQWCHPDFQITIERSQIDDPLFPFQYYLKNGNTNIDINIEKAWAFTKGNNIKIAVIDDGVEDHNELEGKLINGYSPANNTGFGAPVGINSGHGQCCAGIIAASHNNRNIAGIIPTSKIIPINIFDSYSSASTIVQAIEYAWNPAKGCADILSNSWGGPSFDAITTEIFNAQTYGRNGKGCIVVFAAGNSEGNVEFPGNVENVLTVGAINRQGYVWNYSCRGSELEVVAPSGALNNTGDIYTIDREGFVGYSAGDYTSNFGGTSAACPQIAGVAGLLLSLKPELTREEITRIICSTCTKLPNYTFNYNNGHLYGTWNEEVGYGLINAYEAVKKALGIEIIGPKRICDANTTYNYELKNMPANSTISWKSDKYAITQNTQNPHLAYIKTALLKPIGSGTFKITATFTYNNLTDSISFTPTYGAEPPTIKVYSYLTNLPVTTGNVNQLYYAKVVGDASEDPNDYHWNFMPKFELASLYAENNRSDQNRVRFNVGADKPGDYIVSLSYSGNCGMQLVKTDFRIIGSINPPIIITPSPASTNIELTLDDDQEMRYNMSEKSKGIYNVRIYTQQGIIKLEKTYNGKEIKVNVDISSLPTDTYIMHVYDGYNWIQHKLIVQK